jgi:two-component system NtrC family sensor kinase
MNNQPSPESRAAGSPRESSAAPAPAPILLVDDNDDNLVLLEKVLEDSGFTLVKARSGEEALRAVLERDFAAILLDVRMPGMDGFETAEIIRTRTKSKHVPIIFVTGLDATPAHLARGYSAGAVDYLFRPFPPEILRSKLKFFVELYYQSRELAEINRSLRSEIIERKRLEAERDRMSAQLLQGQKLQAIGQLAAGIAHEINNPVSYILSNLGTVREYMADLRRVLEAAHQIAQAGSQENQFHGAGANFKVLWDEANAGFLLEDATGALGDCEGGAVRIREIVKNLKEFAHPDESLLRAVDLTQVVRQSVELCRNELKYQVTLHEDYATLGMTVCYPQQIEQVIVNLLVNAAQAMGEGRGEVFLNGHREGHEAVLQVRDTGIGIPADHLARLFEPFFTTKPVGKGTGLGLHVAYKIVKAHGGQIEVASEFGKGTTFTVRLPVEGPPKASG